MELRTDPGEDVFPRLFGNYVLVKRLASGGMGSVYLARREMGGVEKHCVVKTLRSSFSEDPDYIARFIDEARVVVQLSHRNICPVFDVGQVGRRHYLAMEHMPGSDLRELTSQITGPLRPAMALHLVIEVLDTLDYAHRHKDLTTGAELRLVHRDVSPQNVMINLEGEVKLVDFGLAASSMKDQATTHTQPNIVMGKVAYMAPEHARGDPVDHRSDQFSTAVLAYELFARRRYYGDLAPLDIWRLAGLGSYRPDDLKTLDAALCPILDRALHADPSMRWPSCGAMKAALEEVRYARDLRGGAESLRALMNEQFAEGRESSRRLLATLRFEKHGDDPFIAYEIRQAIVPIDPKSSLTVGSSYVPTNRSFTLSVGCRTLNEETHVLAVGSEFEHLPASFSCRLPSGYYVEVALQYDWNT